MAETVTISNQNGNKFQDFKGSIILSEIHNSTAEITSQTLENGSPLVDHIVILPDELEVNFMVSNFDGNGRPLEGENAKTALQELERTKNNRELLTVTTQHKIYNNMAIQSIGSPHVAGIKGQLVICVKMKKIDYIQDADNANSAANFGTYTDNPALGLVNTDLQITLNGHVSPLYIASSAVTLDNRGRIDSLHFNPQDPIPVLTVNNWFTSFFGIDPNIIATLESYSDLLQQGLYFVQMATHLPNMFQSLVNGVLMQFTIEFNSLLGCWLLNLMNADGSYELDGLILSPGINILDGYLTEFPIKNLFMVELTPNTASSPLAWGNGVSANSNNTPNCVLIYFDDATINSLFAKLQVFKPLNYSLSDLDYTIGEKVNYNIFASGYGPVIKSDSSNYRIVVTSPGVIGLEEVAAPDIAFNYDEVYEPDNGPVIQFGDLCYRIIVTEPGIIGLEEVTITGDEVYSDEAFNTGYGPVIQGFSDSYRIIAEDGGIIDLLDLAGTTTTSTTTPSTTTSTTTPSTTTSTTSTSTTSTTTPLASWNLTVNTTSPSHSISFYLTGTSSIYIDWGDGNNNTYTTDGWKTHTYTSAGTYTAAISGSMTGSSAGIQIADTTYSITATDIISGISGIKTIDGMFAFLTSLTSIPEDLFRYIPLITSAGSVFQGCSGLTSIPANIFLYNTAMTDFASAFSGCTSLTGNAPDLWDSFPTATGTTCFHGDTGLSNYASIPSGWK